MSKNDTFFKAPRYLFRKKNILSWTKNIEFETFIDVGCGAGDLDCSIAKLGKSGKGVDFSDGAIHTSEALRDEYGLDKSVLEFKKQDAFKLVGKEKYDLVISCEVLEHVENDRELLGVLVALSTRYVIVSVPAKEKLFDEWDTMVGHYRRYERANLKKLLEDQGLTVLKFANYGYPFTDIVRYLRRVLAKDKNGLSHEDMKTKTQASGINPVKPPDILYKINLELLITPFYWFSKIFNNSDLSEGYLVLCEKKNCKSADK